MKILLLARVIVCAVLVTLYTLSVCAKTSTVATPAAITVGDADILNLRDFGAVGDGVADDGPALQGALDALASAGGGTLFVPAGRYAVYTPVRKDFTGLASSVSIVGVESSAVVAPTTSTGNEMTRGLALSSEFYPRTGAQQIAVSLTGLRSLLVKDLAFVGTPNIVNDALITLDLRDIERADIRHCEFYGLSSLSPGGSIVQAVRSNLRVGQTLFLGCTAASAHHTPVVQNLEWKGITIEEVIFADYGQRPELYGKCHLSAPVSWINIGNAAQPTSDSPRREVIVRDVVLDEGGYWGLTALPYFYEPASAPIDLIHVSGLRMNVSNLGKIGHLLYNVRQVMVERSTYEWNDTSASAVTLYNVGHAVVSQITCLAGVRTINADTATQRLTVINPGGCTDVNSLAQATTVISGATGDGNPVEYVRERYEALTGRAPDAAGHFYWSDLLIRCGDDVQCLDEGRTQLTAYLAGTPAPTFTLTGRVKDENGDALVGVPVQLNGLQSLSGSQPVTATTDGEGRYSFSNLPTGGQYAVTATTKLYTFDSINVVTPASDVTIDLPGKLNTVQFGRARYHISEGATYATLVVTRTGDTAEAVTVNYLLEENPDETIPCVMIDGTANARCDFHSTAEGVIHFAPGEATKEISIRIIDDAHVEGAETLSLRLAGATGVALGAQSMSMLLIEDNDTVSAQNPISATPLFVRMHYLDFLSREPEAVEPWSAVLNGCSDVNNNPVCDRVLVSQSFFGSPEFRLKGFYVFNFYRVAFGRRPDYAEIIPDMHSLAGATAEETFRKRALFPVSFTDGAEFKGFYDALSDADFVNALLERYALQQIMTLDPSNPEGGTRVVLTRADLINRLGTTGAQALTRAQVLRAVVESNEVETAEYNGAFVAMQYYGYLRRTPEESGYQAWLRVITEDPNNIRIMVNGFLNSTEYRLRFGQP